MKTAIYTRVSTTEQANEGVSLEAQLNKLRAYCQLNNMEVVEIIEDAGISAKNTNRAGYKKLMSLIAAKSIEAVVVYSLSRFSRSTKDTLEAIETMNNKQIAFHSFTEKIDTTSPTGRFFLTVLAGLGQLEREQTAERTKLALELKKSKNERYSGIAPFGYKFENGQIVKCEAEQRVIKSLKELREMGLTYKQIADKLNDRGLFNRNGGNWNKSTIYKALSKAA